MIVEAQSFLVVCNAHGAYGIANKLEDAKRIMRRNLPSSVARKKVDVNVIAFTCPTDGVTIQAAVDLAWQTRPEVVAMKFKAVA